MAKLSERIEYVVGVDTHVDTHTAAVLSVQGALVASETFAADPEGYRSLEAFGRRHAPGRRVWAIEGSGSFGKGLTRALLAGCERVVEIDRPRRPARRNGAKSDALDAVRAAKEALSRRHPAQPRRNGRREALRVLHRTRQSAVHARTQALCQLKALVVTSCDSLRERLRRCDTRALVARCCRLRGHPSHSPEHRAAVLALRSTARRIRSLTQEAEDLEVEIDALVRELGAPLLDQPGVGTLTAAEILCAWSHRGRLRSEAAFAALAGVAPIPASSGKRLRHRLNRGGDRRLNCALHMIVLSRLTFHPETRRYVARRSQEGKSGREIRRCLKRYLARRLFRILEALPETA